MSYQWSDNFWSKIVYKLFYAALKLTNFLGAAITILPNIRTLDIGSRRSNKTVWCMN